MSLINNLDEDNKKKAELLVLNLIDYLFQAISVAINKAHMFSKWLLLGSLISIFSVISSIENYRNFYNAYSIKAFLGCHVLSIICSFIYLFAYEIKDNISQKSIEFFEKNHDLLNGLIKALVLIKDDENKKILKDAALEDKIMQKTLESFFKDLKNKKYVFFQGLFFLLASLVFIIEIMVVL